MTESPSITPIALDPAACARLVGVSRATWWAWHAGGQIPPPAIRKARIVRWAADEIREWIRAGGTVARPLAGDEGGRPNLLPRCRVVQGGRGPHP